MDEEKKEIFSDIRIVINKIKKCKSSSLYTIFSYELKSLYNLCNELGIDDYPRLEDYSLKNINKKNFGSVFFNNILSDMMYHRRFAINNRNINDYKFIYSDTFRVKDYFKSEEYLSIVFDFLNTYDKDLSNLLYKLIIDGRVYEINNYLKTDEDIYTPAYTTTTFGSFKPYIVIRKENCVADLITLVHELGHAKEYMSVCNVSNKELIQRECNCIREVYSFFLQSIFIRYLKKIKFHENDVDVAKLGFDYTFYSWIKKMGDSIESRRIELDFIDYLNYTYGIAISYHFLDRYLNDSEKTKQEIEEFVTVSGQYKFLDLLNRYNLKGELLNPNVLKKYI